MDKIASPQELHSELSTVVAYCGGTNPSREVLASKLRELADRVEPGQPVRLASGKIPIDAIKALTARNQHMEAYILGAKSLGLGHLTKKFELVKGLADLEGHMPQGLGAYRNGLYNDLMKAAEHHMDKDEYQSFRMSF